MKSNRYGITARLVPALLALALVALPQQGAYAGGGGIVRYAKPGGLASGNCATWGTACDLRYALASVALPADQIWAAKGTYKPTNTLDQTISFMLKNGIAVYGGFTGTESLFSQRNPKANVTVLSGNIGQSGSATDNSYHVVTGSTTDSTAILDGFTITAGQAQASDPYDRGAGLYDDAGSPTLRKLIFSGNSAARGGGMAIKNASPRLTNVTFKNNAASIVGGGLYNFSGNPTLTNVSFLSNSAGSFGGGLTNDGGSATLTNASFSGNWANVGGGMYNGTSSPSLTNTTFNGNSANNGGALYNFNSSPTLGNATFSGNSAAGNGGGIYSVATSGENSSPSLTNVTLSGNSAAIGGAIYNDTSATSYLHDSISWSNGSSEIVSAGFGFAVIADSLIAGGCPTPGSCTGTLITANPVLGVLKNNGGRTKTMALGAGSPAIDSGNTSTCAPKDQRGVGRPQGLACDMGAFEVRAKGFVSQASYDGWVLESSENSSIGGGSPNAASTTLRVGDDNSNRQYRSFVSFNTSALPDGASIVLGRLMLMQQGVVGTSPFSTHGTLLIDLANPYFGAGLPLETSDFQAAATVAPAGSVSPIPSSGFYWGSLNSSGRSSISKIGTTQIRLRFKLDDNNDNGADYVAFYSGNSSLIFSQPTLWVYYLP